ncbi:hypothetical protein CSUI_006253 [Cystoisospora suis]|uniref:Uncharacterized protein n=1 Tax=Cystoisospora suis TaxID=483139 RepID=A0A2C6KHE5_9APIC|nr:hypothetical protein CSUI_006253 [Cystoisospora suis]
MHVMSLEISSSAWQEIEVGRWIDRDKHTDEKGGGGVDSMREERLGCHHYYGSFFLSFSCILSLNSPYVSMC